jgi:biotin carboxyl carrier protein
MVGFIFLEYDSLFVNHIKLFIIFLFIEGDYIKAGDLICVLSAMSMEIVVSSPFSGKVEYVAVKESDSINSGDLIIRVSLE